MTPDDLRHTFEQLARGPAAATRTPRHLYLWHGDLSALERLVPPALLQRLDLYALAARLPRTPYAVAEARRLLRAEIERELHDQAVRALRQALVVNGCSLLARYGVPLQPFYSFVGDSRAIVLVVSREETEFAPPAGLPDFVRLVPVATFAALGRAVGEKNVVQA
jgi:hypothetical protein